MANLLKDTLLKNAAKAIDHWLSENHIDAATLERRLMAHEAILDEALHDIPKDQIANVRLAARPFIKNLNADDYARVLTFLWEHPTSRDHAVLLHQRFFKSDFVPAMERVKTWLTASSGG